MSETQLYWLDSGQVGTPLVISSLNGPTDMWGLEYWETDKLMESYIMLNLGLLYLTIFFILNLLHSFFCSLLQTIISLPTKKARLNNIADSYQEHSTTFNPFQSSHNMYSLFVRDNWLIEIYNSDLTIFCILNKLKFYTLIPKTKLKHN